MTELLLALTPFLPLALAAAFVIRPARPMVTPLLPLAALPALVVALIGNESVTVTMPTFFMGLELGMDPLRRPLLLMTAIVWMASALYARGYLPRDAKWHRFNGVFALTMGGNLGLIVALDGPGFYVFFSIMTVSSYLLVAFEQTRRAYAAGRVYIVLSMLGETALLFGLISLASAAGDFSIAQSRMVLLDADTRWPALGLLILGFGIKAGLLPLHIWLPLAHSAAPTPASAVLSGTMLKAGLLGLILFLPLGQMAFADLGLAVVLIGLGTAFYGVICGFPQTSPKTVLAYSSLSQMGVMVSGIGVALASPETAGIIVTAVVIYAVHHGLAKATLFLSVGVTPTGRFGQRAVIVLATLVAISIGGGALTAGSAAKAALKHGLEDGGVLAITVATLLPLSALASMTLLARFLVLLKRQLGTEAGERQATALLWLPFAVLALLSQAMTWTVAARQGEQLVELFTVPALVESFWPVAAGILLALVAGRVLGRARLWGRLPEGDWMALLPSAATVTRWVRDIDSFPARFFWHPDRGLPRIRSLLLALERADQRLTTGPGIALAIAGVAVALAAAIT